MPSSNCIKELVSYPKVSPEQVIEIYEQSRREHIQGYGFFIELMSVYFNESPIYSVNKSRKGRAEPMEWMETLQERLVAAGLDRSYIADYPTLPKYRVGDYCEDGWLIILGTGFNKKLHAPLADGLVERVQNIIGTNKKPTWFTMKRFAYPDPKAWNACIARSYQLSEQKTETSTT